jgi:hypothetical protein
MVRSILGHVQNTLMIMSVLLVMLAFERLQSLDDTGTRELTRRLRTLLCGLNPLTLTDRRRAKARYCAIGSYLDTNYASNSFDLSCLNSSALIPPYYFSIARQIIFYYSDFLFLDFIHM